MYKFLLLFSLFGTVLLAQPNQNWYQTNDRGHHYEGSYTRQVSNPSISLVSLTAGLPAYQFGESQQLAIEFFCPQAEQEYNLHAEELRATQFYWMEDKGQRTVAGWNRFTDWHVDYLLRNFSIDHRNLGILIRAGGRGSRAYYPARVMLSKDAVSIPSIYIAQIRLGRPASGGTYSLYEGQTQTSGTALSTQRISKKSSGVVFPLIVPLKDLASQKWYTIKIDMKEERTGDPFTYSFSFFHAD